MSNKILKTFKVSGVSYCQETINKLKEGDILSMELEPTNKYDSNAIKILNNDNEMCGYIPKKTKIGNDDIMLNVNIKNKFDKMLDKYHLVVSNIHKWDGPTGLEVSFVKKSN